MTIVTSSQMVEIEAAAESYDITPLRLMENAGSAAVGFIRRLFPVEALNCVIFCGPGNNGGDGFVVARKLSELGATVVLALVDGLPKTPQAKRMLEAVNPDDILVLTVEENRSLVENYTQHADLIVDAIFGIGFNGEKLPSAVLSACQMMNEAQAAVVSLDSPTGVSADKGEVVFGAVRADFTIAFQIMKPLHILNSSKKHCGHVEVVEIGIPHELISKVESLVGFISEKSVMESLPKREADSHKGDYGNLLIICGSSNYRGAAVLAATGALRAGTGLCTVAAPEVVCSSVINAVPEAIVEPLPLDGLNQLDIIRALPLIEERMASADAVLFGCGVGLEGASYRTLEFLMENCNVPLILDADALTLLSESPHLLGGDNSHLVLTPHPGEMARLVGTTVLDIQNNRMEQAANYALKYGLTLVLKGHGTIVAKKDGKVLINETGGSGLSKSGSGDFLAGILSGLIAQGMSPESGAVAGVWLHGSAGDRCEKRISVRSMLPHDMAEDLSDIFREYESTVD